MGKGNASDFPGHGNGVGRTAGFKLDLAFDLLTVSTVSQTHGSHQDESLGKYLLNQIMPGDLVVRDLSYFGTASFKIIGEMSAFWLTRVPANVSITLKISSMRQRRGQKSNRKTNASSVHSTRV